jgi:hypothetical protein
VYYAKRNLRKAINVSVIQDSLVRFTAESVYSYGQCDFRIWRDYPFKRKKVNFLARTVRTPAFPTAVVQRRHIFSHRYGCDRVWGGRRLENPLPEKCIKMYVYISNLATCRLFWKKEFNCLHNEKCFDNFSRRFTPVLAIFEPE